MNTHDKYELPTLPEPFTYTRPGKSEGALFHAGHMQDYARAAIEPYAKRIAELESQLEAIGAGGVTQGQWLIEADRKRRGEPVAGGWKLVPETPTSKQIVLMACQIKGADADGWFRTDGDDWPEHVDAAERAYKWALSGAPQPAATKFGEEE